MHEVFEHTADLGLRISAASIEELFAEAGRGLFSLIVENLDDVREEEQQSFEIKGSDRAYLLFDWLNELLYTFDTKHLVLCRFDLTVDGHGLTATVHGEPCEPQRHQLSREVKAITYHGLKVRRADDSWEAEVIVDI